MTTHHEVLKRIAKLGLLLMLCVFHEHSATQSMNILPPSPR